MMIEVTLLEVMLSYSILLHIVKYIVVLASFPASLGLISNVKIVSVTEKFTSRWMVTELTTEAWSYRMIESSAMAGSIVALLFMNTSFFNILRYNAF